MHAIRLSFLFLALFFAACHHDDTSPSNSSIDIIKLKSYATKPGSKAIAEESVVLSDTILVRYADILYYERATHRFYLTPKATAFLNSVGPEKLHGKPFAIAINQKPLYTGYFWAAFSSSICDWVYIDPIMVDGYNFIEVRLGYPWLSPEMQIPDKRNDARLLDVLAADGKLR